MAERVRFELTDPCRSTVFKTAAFGHSATSPYQNRTIKYQFYYSNTFRTRSGVVESPFLITPKIQRGGQRNADGILGKCIADKIRVNH